MVIRIAQRGEFDKGHPFGGIDLRYLHQSPRQAALSDTAGTGERKESLGGEPPGHIAQQHRVPNQFRCRGRMRASGGHGGSVNRSDGRCEFITCIELCNDDVEAEDPAQGGNLHTQRILANRRRTPHPSHQVMLVDLATGPFELGRQQSHPWGADDDRFAVPVQHAGGRVHGEIAKPDEFALHRVHRRVPMAKCLIQT
jgi:hypothetical protein